MPVLSPLAWRLIFYAGIALVLIGVGGSVVYRHEEAKLRLLQSDFDAFKGGVAALGKAALERTKAENAANLKRKKDADKENADALALADRTIAGLRADAAKRSGGRFVPGAPATTKRPDLACFDRIELESAVRGLVAEVRGLVDEGSKSALDLNTARIWAASR